MENMQYAEELVREFLVFRGFTSTLQAFQAELSTDIGKGFQVDKLLDLIFSVYIPKFQAENLVSLLDFFKNYFSSSTDAMFSSTLGKLEISLLRYYIVNAIKCGRRDRVVEFFGTKGNELLQKDADWAHWFAIPYIKNPSTDPKFRLYFSKEWYEALRLSVRNFFNEIFNGTRIPAIMRISLEKNTISRLKKEIKQLNNKLALLQALLEEKDVQLSQTRSNIASAMENSTGQSNRSSLASGMQEDNMPVSSDNQETGTSADQRLSRMELVQDWVASEKSKDESEPVPSKSVHEPSYFSTHFGDARTGASHENWQDEPYGANGSEIMGEEEFPEVKVDFQETFLGHTSPITRCRFSASGNNIASASTDGTVRIWTYESSTSASRNATIYCGTEILSLDWECKSDRLLLIGTADGGIKAWNVDAKRVVCDLTTTNAFPSVLDIKCSPVEQIFVSAAASRSLDSSNNLGFASLTVWNMKMWKAMTNLPLGEDPPAITSMCFNHNGKILAASATDGMIHMFDMSCGLQITGWPAHDSAISSMLFGPDETSIFSLGTDGKVVEWSLHNQGQVLWSINSSRSNETEITSNLRQEMALDPHGRRLLLTSSSVRAPIYQVRSQPSGLRTLPHSAPITTVDWHPTLPMFLTGSADNSVRVTSIL